jgi:hypothetical protein
MESLLETLYIMSGRRGIHGSGHLQAAQEERAGEVSLIMRIDFTQQAQGVMTYHKLLYIYIYICMYVRMSIRHVLLPLRYLPVFHHQNLSKKKTWSPHLAVGG